MTTNQLSYQLHPTKYSLEYALKLKLCVGHYRAAVQATSLISRISHAALTILNGIPGLSVIELIVVSRYGKAATPLHIPQIKYIEIPLIYMGNTFIKGVHHAQFYLQCRQLPKLLEEAKKIPEFQNPLTYKQDEYELNRQSYEEVKAFLAKAERYVELFKNRRAEFGTEVPLFNDLEAQLKKIAPPAENLWDMAKTYHSLKDEFETLNSEIKICGRETSRRAKDWKARAQALNNNVKKLVEKTQYSQPQFYGTHLSPLSDIVMDLLRVTSCLEMEVLLGIEEVQDRALFHYKSRLTVPQNTSVSAEDNDLAKELIQISENLRICTEKATKRLNELRTIKSSASCIANEQFSSFKQHAETWINNAIETSQTEIASSKSARIRLEKPIAAAKIITLLYMMKLSLNNLSGDIDTANEYIRRIVDAVNLSNAPDYGEFAKGVRHRIEAMRAQQIIPLEAVIDKSNPLVKSLKETREKTALYDQKIDLIILWSDIAQCCSLLDQGNMNSSAVLDEVSIYSKNIDRIKEELNRMKENISVFGKLKSYFKESQEDKDKKQLIAICDVIAKLLNQMEQKTQNNREFQNYSRAPAVNKARCLTLLGLASNPTEEQVNKAAKKLRILFHPDFYERKKDILAQEHSIRSLEEAQAKWDEISAAKDALLESIKN